MNICETAAKYADYVVEMRRYFHRHPEVSGKEYNTSRVIKEELDKLGISWRDCGLETGVLATIKGAKPGKTILLRGDIDALTVTEITGAEYASENEGVMHACGHDCHGAMLLTAARILNDIKDELCGTVKLAFQPAEETAQGAKSMIEQGAMEGVDGCFGMHVWADVDSGTVSIQDGPRMASGDQFIVKIKGKGCHGAQPEAGVDAALVTAATIMNLQAISSREVSPMNPVVVTVGTIQTGSRWNVVAEDSVITGTTRCFDNTIWAELPERIERIAKGTADTYRASAELEYIRLVPPTVNNESVASLCRSAAQKVMGEDCLANCPATTGGEDFAYFMQQAPGAIALLGVRSESCGAVHPHHSGKFCVDESQLIKGAMLYAQVAADFNAQ